MTRGSSSSEAVTRASKRRSPRRASASTTLLVTGDPEKICTLPCNPSIGGSAKGQLVREIDALGGAMARIADRCSLHSRFLNESKGPAVRALRQLMDKPAYARLAIDVLRAQPNLTIVQGLVEDLIVEGGAVRGVVCAGRRALFCAQRRARDRHVSRRQDLSRRAWCKPKAASAKRRRSASRTRCAGLGFRPSV